MGKDLFVFWLSENAEFSENKNYPEYSDEQLLDTSLTKSEELAEIKDITTLERLNKLSRICRDSLLTDEQKIALSEYYTDPKNITVEPGSNISVVIDIINNVRHSHIWFNLASPTVAFSLYRIFFVSSSSRGHTDVLHHRSDPCSVVNYYITHML